MVEEDQEWAYWGCCTFNSFLPTNPLISVGGDKGIAPVTAAPYGSALILLISYAYIKMGKRRLNSFYGDC